MNNSYEGYLAILSDRNKSIKEKAAALKAISEIHDRLGNKMYNCLLMKKRFICLKNFYKEFSEKSNELQEQLISVLSSRFEICKYHLRTECIQLIHQNGFHDIEDHFKSSITNLTHDGNPIRFYELLQNFLTLIQWSYGFDFKKTVELLDYIVEHTCDEYFSGLKNLEGGGFSELYKSLHLDERKDFLNQLEFHCGKSVGNSPRYEEIQSYINGIIRSNPPELGKKDQIILKYENKDPYMVWRKDQFGREGFFFRIPITRKKIIRNCRGYITYFDIESKYKDSNRMLHWADVPDESNYRPITINPDEIVNLDFLIKYEKEKNPWLYIQTMQKLFSDHYYFYIQVFSENSNSEIWLEMLHNTTTNSIELTVVPPPISDLNEIFDTERDLTPEQSGLNGYNELSQPATTTQVKPPPIETGVYERNRAFSQPLSQPTTTTQVKPPPIETGVYERNRAFSQPLSQPATTTQVKPPPIETSVNEMNRVNLQSVSEYSELLRERWIAIEDKFHRYHNLKLDLDIQRILTILMNYKRKTEKTGYWEVTSKFKREEDFQSNLYAYFIQEGNCPNSTSQYDVVTTGKSDLLVAKHLIELKLSRKKIDFVKKIERHKNQIKQLTIDREKDIGFLVIMDNSPQKEESTQNKKNEIIPILIGGGRNILAENDPSPIGLICLLINGGIPSLRSRILQ